VIRAGLLIRGGRPDAARQELHLAGGGPLHYRVAAALPGGLMRSGLRLKRLLAGRRRSVVDWALIAPEFSDVTEVFVDVVEAMPWALRL
jgi:hypothetical protein